MQNSLQCETAAADFNSIFIVDNLIFDLIFALKVDLHKE